MHPVAAQECTRTEHTPHHADSCTVIWWCAKQSFNAWRLVNSPAMVQRQYAGQRPSLQGEGKPQQQQHWLRMRAKGYG